MSFWKRLLGGLRQTVIIDHNYEDKKYFAVKYVVNDVVVMNCDCHIKGDKILLADIRDMEGNPESEYYNRGYGTIMMRYLIGYARDIGCSGIYGYLSDVDRGHEDRLVHFYEKFGFIVSYYSEPMGCNYGEVALFL